MIAAVMCGAASAVGMPRLTDPTIGFQFNPSHAAFELVFARVDERNYYTLSFNPKEKRLILGKTANGKASEPLGVAGDLEPFSTVTVWLRPCEIRVELDGRSVIASDDTAFRAEARQLRQPGMAPAKILPVQPNPSIDENFDDHAAVGQRWQTAEGAWSIYAPYDELVRKKNGPPMFSAYRADDPELNLAIWNPPAPANTQADAREPVYGNIRLRAKLRIEQTATAGIAFNVRGKDVFSALAITSAADGNGKVQLLEISRGERIELCAREPVDVRPSQWYELSVDTCGQAARCSVNGEPVLSTCPPAAVSSGSIGLVAWGPGVLFDDLRLRGLASFVERLDHPKPRLWDFSGEIAVKDSAITGTGRANLRIVPPASKRIDVDFAAPDDAEGGIITNCATSTSHYAFGWFAGQWQLTRVIGATSTVMAKKAAERPARCRITLIDRNGIFIGLVDGRPVLDACDSALRIGGVGLIGTNASFSGFRLAEEDAEQGVEVFATDFTGQRGADRLTMRQGDILNEVLKATGANWKRTELNGKTVLTCKEADTLRFRTMVPGDIAVAAKVSLAGSPAIRVDPARPGDGPPDTPAYSFGVNEYGTGFVMLSYGNRLVPQIRTRPETAMIRLMRFGGSVITYADGMPGLKFAERDRLPENHISFSGDIGAVFHSVSIRAPKASFYPFDEVSPDWLELGGEWVLRAGLADPELKHWITGIADEGSGRLVERAEREGSFTWCVTVAPATEGYADGGNTTFPIKNVSLGFCCAGGRLDAGYALQLRPDGKNAIRLLKNGLRTLERTGNLPAGQPVRVRITKTGDKILASLDGKPVLEFTDDAPLDTGHLVLGVESSRARFLDVLILPMD